MKNYEAQISDDQDRRLFEEIKRTSDVAMASRGRATELFNQNKVDEVLKLTNEDVIPAYDKFLKAIELTSITKPSSAKLRQHRKDIRALQPPTDRHRARPRLASGIPSGMAGHSLDKPSPQGHHGQP